MMDSPTQPRAREPARLRQRGVMSMFVAVLLLVGVLFILGQAMGIIGTRSADNMQQLDSTAALALAESGLQRSQAILGASASYGTDASCTGITGGPFALGRGSFTYGTSVSTPPTCGLSGGAPCEECAVTVTGTVGSASRTLNHQYFMAISNGVAGRGQTVTMVLKNTYTVPATALFNLAWQRQSSGGNADATFCANGASGCGLQWNEESSNGNPSIGGMGVTVEIPASTLSKVVVQNLSFSRDYVEVGGLFPSTSSSYPTVVGTYWDDKHVSRLTAVNNGSTGNVINGAAGGTGTCNSAPTTYPSGGSGSFQADTCNQWCTGADTLIFGVAGRSATSADKFNGVTFHTSGTSAQNVALSFLVHFPNIDGSTPNASGKAYSEIWYAHNPAYTSTGTGAGVTSYTSAVKATAGANPVLQANITNNDTTMTVASLADANSKICLGDTLSGDNNINGAVITAPAGCNGSGTTYTFSPAATGVVNKSNVVVSSTTLRVQGATGANFSAGTANVSTGGTVSIASGPSGGNYTLGAAANLGGTVYVTQGANSSTIRVPAGSALPSVGTRVAVYSVGSSPAGAGSFSSGSIVQSVGTDSFTVPSAPSTGLYGATLCGGTCAFFNAPSSASSSNLTEFTVSRSSNTTQWSGGFICLSGVDASKISPVTATTLKTGRWQETVQ
jgi:hypothetical protein